MGWAVFAVATLSYLLTIGPSASLWDCAEFIACVFKLEIGHPPGAPFFMLVYNVISSHLGGGIAHVAWLANATSAVLSGLTILFLFWTITHMVRRVLTPEVRLLSGGLAPEGEVMNLGQGIIILGAGLVGSLVYTYSDSFWFSAVEAEVYAFSSFFTAVVFWLMFKWEERSQNERSDRWLVLIAYLMGLSIGVHLLNLLCLPAMALVYYYRTAKTATLKGGALALLASFALVGLMMYGVIQGVPKLAGKWDMIFVNGLGMSYNSGLYIYLVVLALVLIWGVYETQQAVAGRTKAGNLRLRLSLALSLILMGLPLIGGGLISIILTLVILGSLYYYKGITARVAHLIQMCLVAIAFGFSTYGVILVRAVADPPMNENAPADAFSLRYYLAREQYGTAPLFYGPTFASQIKYGPDGYPVMKEGEPTYGRIHKTDANTPDEYVVRTKKEEPEYEPEGMMLFPRVYDRGHAAMYNSWMGRAEDDMTVPTFGDNLTYFFNYQVNYMYWRYFLWNFVGRQNDLQGDGGLLRGGVMTGIPFIDSIFYGDADTWPEQMVDNKGHNVYYALPLLLGLLGLFFQLGYGRKGTESFWTTFMLFFMTGLAIVLYINQYPGQPRERDYSFAGSFYAFSIWVGFGVAALGVFLSRFLDKKSKQASSAKGQTTQPRLAPISPATALIVTLVGLIIPIQMAGQNWDDHDRSGRTVASDMGHNYLESCDPNAILFCFGDNDTFPLWYAQEVEGIRTDIRTVNLSYLGGDWYIDQMKKQAYEGQPLPIGLLPTSYYYYHIYALVNGQGQTVQTVPEALGSLASVGKDEPGRIATPHLILPVDSAAVAQRFQSKYPSLVSSFTPEMELSLSGKNYLDIGGLTVLDLLASNKWERPIYWAITSPRNIFAGMDQRMVQMGMAYQLLPLKQVSDSSGRALSYGIGDLDRMYELVMTKFRWCGADQVGTYFDENARGIVATLRNQIFTPLAEGFLDRGDKAKAQEVLRKCLSVIREETVPYEVNSVYFARTLYRAGLTKEADHVLQAITRKSLGMLVWMTRLSPEKLEQLSSHGEMQEAYMGISYPLDIAKEFGSTALKHYEAEINQLVRALGGGR